MGKRKRICIVVDAYSTASKLPDVISGYGYPCIHVQSSIYIPDVLLRSFKPESFIENLICTGTFQEIYELILSKEYIIQAVFIGAETGVLLGDYLAENFKVFGNSAVTSKLRRDKYQMAEALKKQGMPYIRHLKTNKLADILQWFYTLNFSKIVLKPLSSSGTYGFFICQNTKEIKEAYASLYKNKDIFGEIIEEILVQEYIEGQEYSINIVSFNNEHYVSEVWKTNKQICKHSKVYDIETLLPETDPAYCIIEEYVFAILSILGIQNGPSHTEIMIKTDGKPILIECASRFMGSIDLALISQAYGTNPILLTAEAYLAPESFQQRLALPKPQLKNFAAMVQLVSHGEGILKSFELTDLISLKTFHGIDIFLKQGDKLQKTVNSYTSPGLVFLSSDDEMAIQHDYQTIRQLEKNAKIYVN